jgi:GDP-mannose 6-dehydrogenase
MAIPGTTAVSVFGLGYVGCVSAACFAKQGFAVVGVDVSPAKVDMVNAGRSTILEEGIGELVAEQVAAGRLRATTSVADAVRDTQVSLVAVGTPSRPNGSIDLRYIERVCEQIGEALRGRDRGGRPAHGGDPQHGDAGHHRHGRDPGDRAHLRAHARRRVRRVQQPGVPARGDVDQGLLRPAVHARGRARPGARRAGDRALRGINAPVHVAAVRVAEAVKYVCNCFHGLKIGFANEVGNVCKALGIDSHEVMRLFCEDRKLNISPAYLKPGFAFGGSCLPKDLRALTYQARTLDVDTPIMSATLDSNQRQIDRAFRMVMAAEGRRVGVLGLAFKAGTDDLRESPMVALIEMLIGKGREVSIYDPYVREANLTGANREYIEREIPHIWTLMRASAEEALDGAETVVIGNSASEFKALDGRLDNGTAVIDLARAFGRRTSEGSYQGICW